MTVTVYYNTDSSAPTLTGQAGSLLGVLDACLVNGYGAKSAAGWTKPYANSGNVGCYQNSASSGTGYCLSVNDSGPGAATYQEARMTGFQTLTSVSAGTGQFPTYAQLAIGTGAIVCRKSAALSATARNWTLIADSTVFYLFIESGDYTNPLGPSFFMFGDIFSYKTNDINRCIIIGRCLENTGDPRYEGIYQVLYTSGTFLTQRIPAHFMAGSWTGVGGSIAVGHHIDYTRMGYLNGNFGDNSGNGAGPTSAYGGTGYNLYSAAFPYPNGPDGGLYISPMWIHHNNWVRGYLKGLWVPLHDRPLNHLDTYSGSGNLSGKSFQSFNIMAWMNSSTMAGQIHMETSSTWS